MGDVHPGRSGDRYRYHPRRWTADLDPRLSPEKRKAGDLTVGRMLINACRPFSWRAQSRKTNAFAASERQKVQKKWRDLLENLSPKGRV